ncbi:MAG: HrpB1 family type III secretion system apparatus protein [Burkholderiaceae bacterium]
MQNNALSVAQMRIIVAAHVLSDKFGVQADTGRILAVMAASVPDRPEIIAAQARNLLIARQYPEARDLLTEAEAKHPRNAVIKALLAMCMFVQKDSLWEAYAEEALALPRDAVALGIVEMLSRTSGRALRGLEARAEPSTPHHYAFVGLAC